MTERSFINIKVNAHKWHSSEGAASGWVSRVTFADDNGDGLINGGERRSINDYYAYGMEWNGSWQKNETYNPKNKYQYNGKELFEEMNLGSYFYNARMMDPVLGRFTSLDQLSSKMPGHSSYSYTMNNPIKYLDPDGRFPITPEFRKNYPQLTSFIENRLQGYIQNSPRMSSTLLNYSTGNLTSSQINSDFNPKSGPTIASHDFLANPDQGGEYHYETNTIRLSNTVLSRFEKFIGSPNTKTWGEMDFSKLFVNEYTHYGDALDGFDAIKDHDGNIINSDISEPGDFPYGVFDEGNEAANELFPKETGYQNYHVRKTGAVMNISVGKVGTEMHNIDPTMIPPDKP